MKLDVSWDTNQIYPMTWLTHPPSNSPASPPPLGAPHQSMGNVRPGVSKSGSNWKFHHDAVGLVGFWGVFLRNQQIFGGFNHQTSSKLVM